MKIVLSETLSYCFGVRKTLKLVDSLLARESECEYYMLGEVVHNEHVIEDLIEKGLQIVRSLDEVPPDGVIILQSHGSPLERYEEMKRRGLEYIDATCPMVKLIHEKIRDVERLGKMPVVIGHEGHEEVKGIVGQVSEAIVVGTPEEVTGNLFNKVTRAGIVVQSTFISEEARRIYQRIREFVPDADFHDTICRPTKIRQKEVEEHALTADDVIVIGSKGSANTMHLYRIARRKNPRTYLVDSPDAVDGLEIPAEAVVFIASGASTPEELIFDVVRRLKSGGKAGDVP